MALGKGGSWDTIEVVVFEGRMDSSGVFAGNVLAVAEVSNGGGIHGSWPFQFCLYAGSIVCGSSAMAMAAIAASLWRSASVGQLSLRFLDPFGASLWSGIRLRTRSSMNSSRDGEIQDRSNMVVDGVWLRLGEVAAIVGLENVFDAANSLGWRQATYEGRRLVKSCSRHREFG